MEQGVEQNGEHMGQEMGQIRPRKEASSVVAADAES